MMRKNNRGVATMTAVAIILLVIIGIYILLYLPFPKFKVIRGFVNYFLIIILWLVLQVGIVFAYYRLGKLVARGVRIYKSRLNNLTIRLQNFLLSGR